MHLQSLQILKEQKHVLLLGENTLISQVKDKISEVAVGSMSYLSTGDGCKGVLARNSVL
jgi:hypothetical protein